MYKNTISIMPTTKTKLYYDIPAKTKEEARVKTMVGF